GCVPMYGNVKINVPDRLQEKMNFEGNIFSTERTDVIISGFSEQNNFNHVLRVYQLVYNNFTEMYDLVQELEAFSFGNYENLVVFFNQLPQLNGIEMLMLLHPFPTELN